MAHKPDAPKLSPLQMADALKAINDAASLFAAAVDSAASLLLRENMDERQTKTLGRILTEEAEKFRAVLWP